MAAGDVQNKERYTGLAPGQASFVVAKLALGLSSRNSFREPADGKGARAQTVLVIVPESQIGESIADDLRFFLQSQGSSNGSALPEVETFFGWEVLPFDTLSPASGVSAARLNTLYRLARGVPTIVVASVDALLQKVVNASRLLAASFVLEIGQELDRDRLVALLDQGGYARSSLVEDFGEMAVRGAVVDFFPPGNVFPVRAELYGDVLESLRTFDPATQRSVKRLERFEVVPVREIFLSRAISAGNGGNAQDLDTVLQRLRGRASELMIPQSNIKPIEEAIAQGSTWPGLEHLQPLFVDTLSPFWDYLPQGIPVAVFDGVESAVRDFRDLVQERAKRAKDEGLLYPEPDKVFLSAEEMLSFMEKRGSHYFHRVQILTAEEWRKSEEERELKELTGGQAEERPLGLFSNEKLVTSLRAAKHQERPFKPLAVEIGKRRQDGYRVAVAVSHSHRLRRMESLLEGYDLQGDPYPGSFISWLQSEDGGSMSLVTLLQGSVSAGFRAEKERLLLIADSELFPEISRHRPQKSAAAVRRLIGSVLQLKEDDYVVHVDYGIGIYRGLRVLTVDEKAGDFLEVEYAEGAKLFVPVDNMGKVQKYSGGQGKPPVLSKLGGKNWEKTKKKVRENVAELAGQLLSVMAARELAPGHAYGPIDIADEDFAAAFPYEETPDQSEAIEAVMNDLKKDAPMDRLVCGDVGYGKTEVALRAAFKVANSGKQTAVLVPTTVLAEQHYQTFKERFAETAVRVGCVSRFYSNEENKRTLTGTANGAIDILIGTHRLLQKDVSFKNLGLLIIDEEHRFGVAHKEKLKRYRANVDILTLTATPIPRTLHMSLAGIRDLSLIETAPTNRQAIRTYVANYDNDIVREAILRELSRGGQIFYIHNRVQDIDVVTAEIRELVPEARIVFAHGQMKDRELESVMHRFLSREIDVLVSTTIVESGLDIPNANTLIVRSADKFGLAELYQLRGRVGRSSRRAYAYLLVSDAKRLGPDAKKRLEVLQSLDDLGVGFRLALQDMEIRGAGNLLGKDQSGHIALIGYELYSKILKDAVEELRSRRLRARGKAGPKMPEVDPEMQIGFPAHIPPEYVPDVAERLLLYQRLISLDGEDEGADILSEIEDRFGRPPEEAHILVDLMVFRSLLRRSGIISAGLRGRQLSIKFHPEAPLKMEKLLQAVKSAPGRIRVTPAGIVSLTLDDEEIDTPRVLYRELKGFLETNLILP